MTASTRRSRSALLALAVVLGLAAFLGPAGVAAARSTIPPSGATALILEPGVTIGAPAHRPVDPAVVRARHVRMNTSLLFDRSGAPRGPRSLPTLPFDLFPGVRFTGTVDELTETGIGPSWSGTIDGVENGFFSVVVVDGVLAAHIGSPLGIYEITSAGGDLYRVVRIDQSRYPQLAGTDAIRPVHSFAGGRRTGATASTATVTETTATGTSTPSTTSTTSTTSTATSVATTLMTTASTTAAGTENEGRIDVFVVYTQAARIAEGSVAAMRARIALAVSETNKGYANSGVTTRIRLVHTHETPYVESGSLVTDVYRLQDPADGFIDGAPVLRDLYGADVVTMIAEEASDCGRAFFYTPGASVDGNAPWAYGVVARPCMTGNYSFGHEIGHIQGADHDLYVDADPSVPFAHGHGYVNVGSDASTRWLTVMAYFNRCKDLKIYCTRINYWSNPNRTYNGTAIGVANRSENYRVLNQTDIDVANYRTTVISGNFSSSFNGSATGWTALFSAWSIYNSAYYRSTGTASSWAMAAYGGTYGDVTVETVMRRMGTCTTCPNGIWIRMQTDPTTGRQTGYAFYYTASGSYTILRYDADGTATRLVPWTASSAIRTLASWNTLKVVAINARLSFTINGTALTSVVDGTYRVGAVGVAFYRDANGGTLDVDWMTGTNTPT